MNLNLMCKIYKHRRCCVFTKKFILKKRTVKKRKKKEKLSWWWAGPDLPNEEKEETRILVHPILTRTQQQGEYYGLVQEWKRYHSRVCTFQDVSGAVWSLVSRVGIPYEEVQKSFQRATLVGVVFGCVSEVKSYFFFNYFNVVAYSESESASEYSTALDLSYECTCCQWPEIWLFGSETSGKIEIGSKK